MNAAARKSNSVEEGLSSAETLCDIRTTVMDWFVEHGRQFPWRESAEPFHILIAEVLLRQTHAPRVVDHYSALVAGYPDPQSLAKANKSELREWFAPLGLNRRADRLVDISELLVQQYDGRVPRGVEDLERLPGIGTYSSRAILCLAFDYRIPMVDGGSGRLLRRLFSLSSRRPAFSDKKLLATAESLLPSERVREFNLGLIDLSAAYCRPRSPNCGHCPLSSHCLYARSAHAS